MKSFPSSFTKNNLVQTGIASTNIKQTLKNIAGATMNNILSGGKNTVQNKQELGSRLQWPEYDYNESLSKVSFIYSDEIPDATHRLFIQGQNRAVFENANKIPALVLASMNKYRTAYKHSVIQVGQKIQQRKDAKGKEGKGEKYRELIQEVTSPSLFNPWYGVRAQGFVVNSPLMYNQKSFNAMFDDVDENHKLQKVEQQINLNNADPDFTDCSIKTLVALSNGKLKNGEKSSLGRCHYRYADFMYCKDLGKISNNHLITLRKFTHPIGDNIFKQTNLFEDEIEMIPDSGRLVTWFGTEDNKLEDICKFNYKTTWKEMNASIEDVQSKEDNPKLLPSIVNILNPQYRAGAKNGLYGNNAIYKWIEGRAPKFFAAESPEANDSDRFHMDTNKIWTPKNTIQSTHLYEGKIEFSQEFTLTFCYKLRSYDGINPKSAFLDLVGNILEITHKRGKFWGGARRWLGAPRNQQGWNMMNQLFAKGEDKLHEGIDALFGCSSLEDLANLCGSALKAIGGFIEGAKDMIEGTINKQGGPGEVAKKAVHGAASTLTGMLKNKLGRPAVYAINSLLNGENVGLWHVTIGNPRNPIMSMGNLIMTNAEITHSGPLGIDDFPTELKVVVSLKHARPRDLTDIASMYTCGQGGLLLPLGQRDYKNFIDPDKDLGEYGLTGMSQAFITGEMTNPQKNAAAEAAKDAEAEKQHDKTTVKKGTTAGDNAGGNTGNNTGDNKPKPQDFNNIIQTVLDNLLG